MMAGRAVEGVAKLCQRRLYSWLSSRCGVPICIIGGVLLLVSVLQFGEVGRRVSEVHLISQFSRCCWSGVERDTNTSSVSMQTTSLENHMRDCEFMNLCKFSQKIS